MELSIMERHGTQNYYMVEIFAVFAMTHLHTHDFVEKIVAILKNK